MERCFHCQEPNPKSPRYELHINDSVLGFCCLGCQEIARSIFSAGLDSYYQHRSQAAKKSEPIDDALLIALAESSSQQQLVHREGDKYELQLYVEDMVCPACAWLIERRLRQADFIEHVSTIVTERKVNVRWCSPQSENGSHPNNSPQDRAINDILTIFAQIGYRATPFSEDVLEQKLDQEKQKMLRRLAVAGLGMMQAMMYAIGLYLDVFNEMEPGQLNLLRWSSLLVATPVVFYSASPFFKKAWSSLKARALNMDLSVSLAVLLAYFASVDATMRQTGQVYFESVTMFVFLLLLGRFIELNVRRKAIALTGIRQRTLPQILNVEVNGLSTTLAAHKVKSGDTVIISSGEVCAVDGELLSQSSQWDQSHITGESTPITIHQQGFVPSGSLAITGPVKIRVTRHGADAYVAMLSRLTDAAIAQKPGIQLWSDKIARYFIMIILIITGLAYVYWQNSDPVRAMEIAIALLVVTCPCALSLALPTAWATAIRALLRHGVLIRKSEALEQLTHVTHAMFDKTGTLTTPDADISNLILYDNSFTKTKLMAYVAALETHSTHPIAHLFRQKESAYHASNVQELTGYGIVGDIHGTSYWCGSARLLTKFGITHASDHSLFFGSGDRLIASMSLQEKIKSDAATALNLLKRYGLVVSILSGDRLNKVEAVAKVLNVDPFLAEQTPEQKQKRVHEMHTQGKCVLMIGDGINDGPVLNAASVSIAVGNASALARQSADVVILSDELLPVPKLMQFAQETQRVVKQNLVWALAYNAVAIPFAAMGWVPPWLAAIGMTLSSLLVTMNSLRLSNAWPKGVQQKNISMANVGEAQQGAT